MQIILIATDYVFLFCNIPFLVPLPFQPVRRSTGRQSPEDSHRIDTHPRPVWLNPASRYCWLSLTSRYETVCCRQDHIVRLPRSSLRGEPPSTFSGELMMGTGPWCINYDVLITLDKTLWLVQWFNLKHLFVSKWICSRSCCLGGISIVYSYKANVH